jgi:hypothetical protein
MFLMNGEIFGTFGEAMGEMARSMARDASQFDGMAFRVEYRRADGTVVPVAHFRYESGEWRGNVQQG